MYHIDLNQGFCRNVMKVGHRHELNLLDFFFKSLPPPKKKINTMDEVYDIDLELGA